MGRRLTATAAAAAVSAQAEDTRVVLRSRCLHCAECGLRQGAIVRDSQVLVTPPGDPDNFEYSIELVELDDDAGVWAGAYPGCPDAYGSAGEVIAALTSRPLDDPWVREVVAALGRDREWATRWGAGTGRLRQHLEIVRGRGKRVHATAAAYALRTSAPDAALPN